MSRKFISKNQNAIIPSPDMPKNPDINTVNINAYEKLCDAVNTKIGTNPIIENSIFSFIF